MPARLVVLISGSGTNLQAIIDAIAAKKLDAEIVLVISNRKAAFGLVRAEQAGIPTLYFPLKPYANAGREAYDRDLAERVKLTAPDLIVLAGWMHIFTPEFLNLFPHQVINLHPALPGYFAGAHAIERSFEAYQRGEVTQGGCMVHYVIPEVDAGEVVAQAVVPIRAEDSLESFEARLHAAEHQLLVDSIRQVIEQQPG